MSYVLVSWEVSTGDPTRSGQISAAVKAALDPFSPAKLLTHSNIIDTESQNVADVRSALDAVRALFPQEFFYSSADQLDTDIQGIYPPSSELARARQITGSVRNPRERTTLAVPAAAGGPEALEPLPARRPGGRRGLPGVPPKRGGGRRGRARRPRGGGR